MAHFQNTRTTFLCRGLDLTIINTLLSLAPRALRRKSITKRMNWTPLFVCFTSNQLLTQHNVWIGCLYDWIIGVCTAHSGYSFFLHYMYTEMIGFWKIMLYITLVRPINNALFQMGCSATKLQSSGNGRYELQLEISSRKRFHLYHI